MLENSNDVDRPAYKHTRVAYISISDFLAVQKGGGQKDKEGGGVCKHNMWTAQNSGNNHYHMIEGTNVPREFWQLFYASSLIYISELSVAVQETDRGPASSVPGIKF